MLIHDAVRLLRETCALQHIALKTEKSYSHWVFRYATFLKTQKAKLLDPADPPQYGLAMLKYLCRTIFDLDSICPSASATLFSMKMSNRVEAVAPGIFAPLAILTL